MFLEAFLWFHLLLDFKILAVTWGWNQLPSSGENLWSAHWQEQNWRKYPGNLKEAQYHSVLVGQGHNRLITRILLLKAAKVLNLQHQTFEKILFYISHDSHFLSVLSGQRAADASQPAQTLRPGPHHAGQEGIRITSTVFVWILFSDSTGVTLILWFWFFRVLSWTVRRDSATWPRNRRSPSWRTTWNSSPRSTSR